MTNINIYKPTESSNVFSSVGRQMYKSYNRGDFYYYSPLFAEDSVVDKSKVDDVWLNGSYYIIQKNIVYKKNNSGEVIASVKLGVPICLSSRQHMVPIPSQIDGIGTGDNGCWIVDSKDKRVILCDSNLIVVDELINLSHPVFIMSTYDGGAYFFDDDLQGVYKINEDCDVVGYFGYSLLNIESFYDIKRVDIDIDNNLWYLIDFKLIKIAYDNGSFNVDFIIDSQNDLGINFANNTFIVSDFVIEKSTERNVVYLCGCVEGLGVYYEIWISKIDLFGQIVKVSDFNVWRQENLYGCPILLAASQWGLSDALYLVFEENVKNESSSSSSSLDETKKYNYYINILQIDPPRSYPSAGQGPNIPCPRVNSWAEGEPPSNYYIRPQAFLSSHNSSSSFSGVDVFFWNEISAEFYPQEVSVTATGNPTVIISAAGSRKDQTKYQLKYDVPGDYIINIKVFNKSFSFPQIG